MYLHISQRSIIVVLEQSIHGISFAVSSIKQTSECKEIGLCFSGMQCKEIGDNVELLPFILGSR